MSEFAVCGSEEQIVYRDVAITLWRTSTTDRPPKRRWHFAFDGVRSHQELFSRGEAIASARWHVDEQLDGHIPLDDRIRAKADAVWANIFGEIEDEDHEQTEGTADYDSLILKLENMTVKNGCTHAEAENARRILENLKKISVP